jgi:outer membrane protein assembly factor BamA
MRRHRFALILTYFSFAVLAAPFGCIPAHAQNSYILGEVHASGSHRYTDALVAATAGLNSGDPIDGGKLQAISEHLAQLGIFTSVNFRFTVKNNRAIVNFELEDAPLVPVLFENFAWFTDQELSDEVRHAVPLFDGFAPRGGSLLDEITAALSAKLASQGIKANVEHMLVGQPSSEGEVMEFLQTGVDFNVAAVSFGDSMAANSEKLRDRASDLVGKKFSRFALELFQNEQVRPIYFSAGRIRVKFGAPAVHLNTGGSQQSPTTVSIQVPIEPGSLFHFSGVSWAGNMAIDAATLSRSVGISPGELADGMRLAAGWQQIELEYGHRGYLDAKVTPVPQFDDSKGTVRYEIKIMEGPQYRMGRLVITGLSVDAERALRNAWQLAPGQAFDKTFFDSMLAKLEKPTVAVFGELPVHYGKMGNWLRPNEQTHVMDVLIDFQ